MPSAKRPFAAGDCFEVPIENDDNGYGVISRCSKNLFIGYFYLRLRLGLNHGERPTLERLGELLTPYNAEIIISCTTDGLFNGEWKVFGKLPGWTKQKWPCVQFADLFPNGSAEVFETSEFGGVKPETTIKKPLEQYWYTPMYGPIGWKGMEISLEIRNNKYLLDPANYKWLSMDEESISADIRAHGRAARLFEIMLEKKLNEPNRPQYQPHP